MTLFDNLPAGLRRRLRRFGLFCVVFFLEPPCWRFQLPPPPLKPSDKGFFSKKSSNERPTNLSLVVKGHYWWPLCYWSCLKIRKKAKKGHKKKEKSVVLSKAKGLAFFRIEDRGLLNIKKWSLLQIIRNLMLLKGATKLSRCQHRNPFLNTKWSTIV